MGLYKYYIKTVYNTKATLCRGRAPYVIVFFILCAAFITYLPRQPAYRPVKDNTNFVINENIPDEILPLQFWSNNRKKQLEFNQTCAKFPNLSKIAVKNIFWQTFLTSYGSFELFRAYLDNRFINQTGSFVRILALSDQSVKNIKSMYCQIWFEDLSIPSIVSVMQNDVIWKPKRRDLPVSYLISCQMSKEHKHRRAIAVSLVEHPCDTANNSLKVMYKKSGNKQNFAVCVDGIDLLVQDNAIRLVEWIETVLLLGAHKIFFYQRYVHPEINRVLKYYEKQNLIMVTSLAFPTSTMDYKPNLYFNNKNLGKIIPYNDCLYNHMYDYQYLVLLNPNEIVLPVNSTNWQELMISLKPKLKDDVPATYGTKIAQFFTYKLFNKPFSEVPQYMYMLQHVYKHKDRFFSDINVKIFHNTDVMLTVDKRETISCFDNMCSVYSIEDDVVFFQFDTKGGIQNVKVSDVVVDKKIWRYKDQLIKKVNSVVNELKLS